MMTNNRKTKRRTFRKALALLLVLLLTFGTALSVTAASVTPVAMSGNDPDASSLNAPAHCEELSKLKIDPPQNGIYTSGDFEVTVTFSVYDSDENEYNMVSWSLPKDSEYEVFHVFVKGGSDQSFDGPPAGGNLFSYSEGSTGDNDLFALNYQGISHVSFYFCEATPEETEEKASLTIIKELFDEEDVMVEESDEAFEVLINNSEDEEFWLGDISVDEGYSNDEMELGTYFIKENVDDEEFEVTYMMDETELTADEDGFIQVDLDEDGDSVTITVQNRTVADDDPDDDDPVDDPDDDDPVDDPDDDDPVDDPDDDDPVDDPDDDDPVDDPDETITVPDTTPPAGGGGGGGIPAVETTVVEDPVVTIEEPVVPLAAPEVEVEAPVIILDEPIPLAPPVLPQTGDSNPLHYSLAGLLLMAVGFIFRKRLAA